MEPKERKKHTWADDDKKRLIEELSKFADDKKVGIIAEISAPRVAVYSFKGPKTAAAHAPVCYASMLANGFKVIHKRPMVIWAKDDVEVTLGFDYLPESITIGCVEVEFKTPVWTIGELNEIIKKNR